MRLSLTALLFLFVFIGCGGEEDPCAGVVCGTNGTCVSGSCDCNLYFAGKDCDMLSRTKFLGDWSGTGQCSMNPANTIDFGVKITEEPRIGAVFIQSGQLFQGFRMTGLMNEEDNVNIPLFKPFVGANDYEGQIISIDSSNIEMTLNVIVDGEVTNSCVYMVSK